MTKLIQLSVFTTLVLLTTICLAQQDKSKRPSPPAQLHFKTSSGAHVTIDYSKPSIKGRTIGKDIEPMEGKVWRTGANEATWIEVDKDVLIEGKKLPAGKYGLFSILNGDEWTIIFNKTWNQWGAMSYKEADDQLRVKVKNTEGKFAEQLSFSFAEDAFMFNWGNKQAKISIK